jgi:hypothetical protein
MNGQITKNLEIDFTLLQVKNAINHLIENNLKSGYKLVSKNETFNSYQFTKLKGLGGGMINVELKKINEATTNINTSVVKLQGSGNYPESLLSEINNKFLDDLASTITNWDKIEIEKTELAERINQRNMNAQKLKEDNPVAYYSKFIFPLLIFVGILFGLFMFIKWITNLKH